VLSERDEARRVARLVKGEHVSACGKGAGGTCAGAKVGGGSVWIGCVDKEIEVLLRKWIRYGRVGMLK
jgi:hypothetical protein